MKHLFCLLVLAIAGCTTPGYSLGNDPADLTSPGASLESLVSSGWEISLPVKMNSLGVPAPADPSASDGRSWSNFVSSLTTDDELRPVRNNAGIGYAVFRGGKFLDLYLTTIF